MSAYSPTRFPAAVPPAKVGRGGLAAAVAAVALLAAGGCRAADSVAIGADLPLLATQSLVVEQWSPPPRSPDATWSADPARLDLDLHRTLRALGWAEIRRWRGVSPVAETEPSSDPTAGREPGDRCFLQALLPDDRVARVWVQISPPDTLRAWVVVGRFGDAESEAAFLRALRNTMAQPPARGRLPRFTLPEAAAPPPPGRD